MSHRIHLRSLSFVLAAIGPVLFMTPGCGLTAATPDSGPLTPPFVVSDHYAPTGYMGDGTTIGAVDMKNDNACPDRSPDPSGDCYSILYTPILAWAGVYWQYPANNWGDKPGREILPGATTVTVWAKGAKGGEKLELHAGGIADNTKAYSDKLAVQASFTLTTEWKQYTVKLGSKPYTEVIGGFAWICHAPVGSTDPIVFYLDGIEWST